MYRRAGNKISYWTIGKTVNPQGLIAREEQTYAKQTPQATLNNVGFHPKFIDQVKPKVKSKNKWNLLQVFQVEIWSRPGDRLSTLLFDI